ncbi:hypothetical protein H7S74_22870 [Priestia aryabhattai]|uniref:hypothetical protein n=1 Tax=Priestia TaxID=2800373 RepID=UPI000E2EAA23|nr:MULTISPECIES: hypothetical protein [Priestia]MBY0091574.1 hypothetical protein [Priestia aryabhattai]MBY0104198.1 hypothetical protein [Priestia aryabhattai]MCM3306955.1 hypothetical protein [Priestia megaterium]MCU7740152.1 hypothetical protein [Priestia megaterium]NEW01054.1 hypothetical protein [Priestia megaterium]
MGNTTNMLIEHLINGFHFFVAIILLVLTVLGLDFFQPLYKILIGSNKDILLAIFILFLPLVYTLGLIIDNFVDDIIFQAWENKIKNNESLKGKSARELIMLANDQNQANQFDYIRMKIRITRTSTFNFTLITILSFILSLTRLYPQYLNTKEFMIIATLIITMGLILTYLSFWSWKNNTISFRKRVNEGFKMYERNKTME